MHMHTHIEKHQKYISDVFFIPNNVNAYPDQDPQSFYVPAKYLLCHF